MVSDSSILAWRISMDRGAWWATVYGESMGRKESAQLKQLSSNSGSVGGKVILYFPPFFYMN